MLITRKKYWKIYFKSFIIIMALCLIALLYHFLINKSRINKIENIINQTSDRELFCAVSDSPVLGTQSELTCSLFENRSSAVIYYLYDQYRKSQYPEKQKYLYVFLILLKYRVRSEFDDELNKITDECIESNDFFSIEALCGFYDDGYLYFVPDNDALNNIYKLCHASFMYKQYLCRILILYHYDIDKVEKILQKCCISDLEYLSKEMPKNRDRIVNQKAESSSYYQQINELLMTLLRNKQNE